MSVMSYDEFAFRHNLIEPRKRGSDLLDGERLHAVSVFTLLFKDLSHPIQNVSRFTVAYSRQASIAPKASNRAERRVVSPVRLFPLLDDSTRAYPIWVLKLLTYRILLEG
jgi:hypothetical protein